MFWDPKCLYLKEILKTASLKPVLCACVSGLEMMHRDFISFDLVRPVNAALPQPARNASEAVLNGLLVFAVVSVLV